MMCRHCMELELSAGTWQEGCHQCHDSIASDSTLCQRANLPLLRMSTLWLPSRDCRGRAWKARANVLLLFFMLYDFIFLSNFASKTLAVAWYLVQNSDTKQQMFWFRSLDVYWGGWVVHRMFRQTSAPLSELYDSFSPQFPFLFSCLFLCIFTINSFSFKIPSLHNENPYK